MNTHFQLRKNSHAIGEFSATLQFFNPVTPSGFVEITAALNKQAEKLNLPAVAPVFAIQLGQQGPGPAPQMMQPTPSSIFQRYAPNGEIEESLTCDPQSITYTLYEYQSWKATKPRVKSIFLELSEAYIKEVPAVHSIRLQYLNQFRTDVISSSIENDLIRPDTTWVAHSLINSSDSWHSHVGTFVSRSDNKRNLVNVNCDVAHNVFATGQIQVIASVLFLAGCYYNISGLSPFIASESNMDEFLDVNLEEAHSLEKSVLRQVICDPYLIKMGALHDD